MFKNKNKLKQKRQKKWNKFKNAEVTSLNIEVIDIPNNFMTDNRLWRKKVQKINQTITNEKPPEESNISRIEKTCDRVSYADIVRENKPKHDIDFRGVYLNLLEGEGSNDSKVEISPPSICTNTAELQNSSSASFDQLTVNTESFRSQDRELISILYDLQNMGVTVSSNNTETTRLIGHFCSDTVFNLIKRVLTDAEISVLEKGLDYAPILNKINEPELRTDFEEFCRRMRLKWYFRNEPTSNFSEVPAFRTKSTWNPPKGHPNLEVFLSEVEKELFSCTSKKLGYSNLSTEEWKAMRSLADDRSIVIKKADKGSSVVVWDRNDYVMEAEKQLSDANVYKDVSFNEKMLQDLVGTSSKLFQNLKSKGKISDKQLKYFTYEYKKASNLGKLYLLPKIHKRLSNVPGRPVISNCGTPTEKTSEFLDYHLKPIMQKGKSYIKDSGDFMNKVKSIENIPEGSILVTADVVGLYPSIPHEAGLNALRETLESRENKFIKTEDLIKMASFVLKNNIFEFNGKVKQQISGTAIGTKFAPA